jgi:hypothetical protein
MPGHSIKIKNLGRFGEINKGGRRLTREGGPESGAVVFGIF